MSRYLDPTNDVSFKRIFSDEGRLKDFLNVMLDLPEGYKLISLTYMNTEEIPNVHDGKRSYFDLKVKDQAGNWYIIEMQKRSDADYMKRVQYYSCHSYVEQLKSGILHKDLLPVIVVSLMKGKLFPDDVPCISYHKTLETSTKTQHLFDLSYVFIELGKYKADSINNDKDEWLHLFKCAEVEESLPTKIKNSNVKSSYDLLESYKWTTEQRDAYIRAKLTEDAEKIRLDDEYDKGKIDGKTERDIEIAKNSLAIGIDIKTIMKITGLTEEEILKLGE